MPVLSRFSFDRIHAALNEGCFLKRYKFEYFLKILRIRTNDDKFKLLCRKKMEFPYNKFFHEPFEYPLCVSVFSLVV